MNWLNTIIYLNVSTGEVVVVAFLLTSGLITVNVLLIKLFTDRSVYKAMFELEAKILAYFPKTKQTQELTSADQNYLNDLLKDF